LFQHWCEIAPVRLNKHSNPQGNFSLTTWDIRPLEKWYTQMLMVVASHWHRSFWGKSNFKLKSFLKPLKCPHFLQICSSRMTNFWALKPIAS